MPLEVGTLRIEELATTAALEELRPDWERLWAAIPGATPFQAPDWLIPWWRHIGEGALLSLALRDGAGALIGFFPFYVYASPGSGERSLFPLGIATTDYLDALVLPGREEAAMAAAFGHLAARQDAWDVCDWPQLRPGSPLLEAPPPGWDSSVEPAEPCPALRLPASVTALDERVSGKTLRDLRAHRRRAAALGDLRWETADRETLGPIFEALLRLHAARWATRGEGGVLASPGVQAAHREALPGLLRAGLLRLHALRLDGEIAAVIYGLADPPGRDDRRVYFYLSGFDPRLERASPGMLLVGHAVESAIAEGMAYADFLRGRETYKYFWGAEDGPNFRRRLTVRGSG
jgi:CelD/BcsL family acetyltransferase involved in cellulose biosynthesis